MNKKYLLFIILIIDQFLKHYFLAIEISQCPGMNIVINKGIAFGLLNNGWINPLLITIYIVTAITIVYIYRKIGQRKDLKQYQLPLLLILIGVLSNLMDRLLIGGVIDYIDLCIWPVFNLGDASINLGAILIVFYLIKNKKNS